MLQSFRLSLRIRNENAIYSIDTHRDICFNNSCQLFFFYFCVSSATMSQNKDNLFIRIVMSFIFLFHAFIKSSKQQYIDFLIR